MKQLTGALYLCSAIFISLYLFYIKLTFSSAYHFMLWIFPIVLVILFFVTMKPNTNYTETERL